MVANFLPVAPFPTLGVGSKGQPFSEHGNVAYQIKGNNQCINMQAHILSLYTSAIFGVGSKVKTFFFLKVVMLHIKFKGMEHRTPCKNIFCPYTQPRPLGWGKMSKHTPLRGVMLHVKLKGMGQRARCKHIFCPYTHPRSRGGVKVSKHFILIK